MGQDRTVNIATCYGLDGPGIEPWWRQDFPHPFRLPLRPTQPSVQWVLGLSRGLSTQGVTLTTHPASSAVVKERVELYLYSPYGS